MKKILLIPGPALSNKMEITVMDLPCEIAEGIAIEELKDAARKRCVITVEYGRPDVMELKAQDMGLEEALEYYRNHIYNLVKFHILSDWEALDGMEASINIVSNRIKDYWP